LNKVCRLVEVFLLDVHASERQIGIATRIQLVRFEKVLLSFRRFVLLDERQPEESLGRAVLGIARDRLGKLGLRFGVLALTVQLDTALGVRLADGTAETNEYCC